ncbi:MAG: cryptochrome/photolyase family protein [Betaproteobacteria bacterium]
MKQDFKYRRALVWFRRDLRDYDHTALGAALREARDVFCAFVFDHDILDTLLNRRDRRLQFIHASLVELDTALRTRGGGLMVLDGRATEEIPRLATRLSAQAVFANRDYEPRTKARDAAVASALADSGIAFLTPKDQAIFDHDEVLTAAGRPFSIFTPYSRVWLRRVELEGVAPVASDGRLARPPTTAIPSLTTLGFIPSDLVGPLAPGMQGGMAALQSFLGRIDAYGETRDFPAAGGTSRLSPHLRFGTVSIRQLVAAALERAGPGAETWLKELIWRDFYFQILDHFPHVEHRAFKSEYDAIRWDDWPEALAAWYLGLTGYPLVDAGMRQLADTGFMHNRLRMVTASFLCKDLGIDWRLGERHFAEQLDDFDLSANNGGWQWSASTGCDAQPWFRIFNPVTQSEKFDPRGEFIRRFIRELAGVPDRHIHAPWRMSLKEQEQCGVIIGRDYPAPIVDHEKARQRTLARYEALKNRASA